MNKRTLVALVIVTLSAGAAYGQCQFSTGAANITSNCGNVGIGVAVPVSKLEAPGSTSNSSAKFGSYEIQSYAVNNAWLSDNIYYNGTSFVYRANGRGALSYFENGGFEIRTTGVGTAGATANLTQRFVVQQDGAIGLGGSQTNSFVTGANVIITAAGNVGIGVASPTQKLDVAGSINVSGNINAKYQDVAEWVPSSVQIPAGTVVVLDQTKNNEVIPSSTSYDTTAAGVVSAKPGISLGEASSSKVQVATFGRVKVRVDATKNPIKIGDLLVTSDKPGMAMKSNPMDFNGVAMHRPGTIIGKALEPIAGGEGEILVLLALH